MPHRLLRTSAKLAVALLAAVTLTAVPAAAAVAPLGVVHEVTAGITADSEPYGIVAGPDGNLWFTEPRANRIARMTPRGVVTELTAGIPAAAQPLKITVGPDGNLWTSEARYPRVLRVTPAGSVTELPTGPSTSRVEALTTGPDGNVWYVKRRTVGRIAPDGTTAEFGAGISVDSLLTGIAAGPDGNLWVTDYTGGQILRVGPDGSLTAFASPLIADGAPSDITAGPDGALWFTLFDGRRIGRVTTSGDVSLVGPVLASGPRKLVTGPDGALWFTEEGDRIGRLTTAGALREFHAGITAGSSPMGITAGPDNNLWFASYNKDRVARIGAGAPMTVTCSEKGGVTAARLKVVCRTTGLGASATLRWRVARKDTGALVARGRKPLVDGTLVVNLTRSGVRRGRHLVTLTRGTGIDRVVVVRVLRLT